MHSYYRILALVVVLLVSCSSPASANIGPARPLKRFAHPSTQAIEILPRQPAPLHNNKRSAPIDAKTLRYDDSFRLTISAFDERFYLHLRPNDHLIHSAARITYHTTSSDGSIVSHSKPLLRESVKAYWGEVIAEEHSPARMREDVARVVPRPHPATLGWARIMVHHQGDVELGIAPEYEGAFSVKGVVYHVMTRDNYLRSRDPLDPDFSQPLDDADSLLVIWRESDVMNPSEEHFAKTGQVQDIPNHAIPQSCGHDRLSYNTDPSQNPILQKPVGSSPWYVDPFASFRNTSITRRGDISGGQMGSNFIDDIGQTAGCPSTQKVLYMGVAADCEYTTIYGSPDNATKQILTNWNSASALYKTTFNVSLGIVELQVQDATCPSTPDASRPWNIPCNGTNLDTRLSLFSQWRGDKGDDGTGLWHLMSGCPTGSEVGIAWLATLCQQGATGSAPSIVSGTAVSTAGRTEWQVVAHETGHNFGAIHDCADGCTTSDACCPFTTSTCNANAQFIMSPVSEDGEKTFSQCTIGNICSLMIGNKVATTCLVDPGSGNRTISLQMCGNGIVEDGEDCDPGSGLQSSCCDAATCKFKPNAVCDPQSSPCCSDTCTFAPATKVCRPAKDDRCDTAETCTGNSSSCPEDKVSPNGQSCGDNNLKCASGQCTSIALQCQTAGASLGLKEACPGNNDNSCQVSCQDPSKSNQCIQLASNLIDGSPCGLGGTCVVGKCQTGSFLDTAKAWYRQNLKIAIPVTVVGGIVVLLLLWGIFRWVRSCCCARSRKSPVLGRTGHERLDSNARPPSGYVGYPTGAPPLTASLQPGARASYTRVPLAQHARGQSRTGGSHDWQQGQRTQWVDESQYNGYGYRT